MGPLAIDENVLLRLSDQTAVTREELVQTLSRHRVVLIGEAHDNPAHHEVQLTLIRELRARRPAMVVAMEMFPGHLQPQLDRWVAGELEEEAFLDAVEWYFTWGFDAGLYLPILRYAREERIPLLAMNTRRDNVTQVRKKGLAGVEIELRDTLPPVCPATPAYRMMLEEVFNAHPMMSHSGKFDHFVEAQGVWDSVMADRIKRWSDAHPDDLVVGLAGNGHLLGGHGIVHQLRGRGVTDIVTLLPWSGAESRIDRDAGDFAWGTPATPEPPPPVQLGITMDDKEPAKVLVTMVMPDSLAERMGLRAGDRLLALNGQPLTSRHALARRVRGLSPGTELMLRVEREGREEELRHAIP
ncbi:MAG: ChaN family lipoprotein [Magnetococcales bacterium]|nr:ChaN family lipoprotein [Magnetococcales bacterium]